MKGHNPGSPKLSERVTVLETERASLATSAQVSELAATIREMKEENTRQHTAIKEMLFGAIPTSLQSQITAVKDATIGDSPLSLRSRITQVEQGNAVSKGQFALLASICSGLGVFVATKWKEIAEFFGAHFAR